MIQSNYSALMAPHFRKLSDDQLARIHAASLEILERTGVQLHHQEALDLLRQAAAHVQDEGWVRIPAHRVEWALRTAPKRIISANRHGRSSWRWKGATSTTVPAPTVQTSSTFAPASVGPARRYHRGRTRVLDALPNINLFMSFCMASDKPQVIADRYQMQALLSNSIKPILFVTTDFPGCVDCVEMAEIVAGGADALCENPIVACYVNVTIAAGAQRRVVRRVAVHRTQEVAHHLQSSHPAWS